MNMEVFENMLNRIVSLSTSLESERAARTVAEHKASATFNIGADVFTLMACLSDGRKIEAIKAYRALTGFGLLESKNAIEGVMNRATS